VKNPVSNELAVADQQPVLEQALSLTELVDLNTFGDLLNDFAQLYRLGVQVVDEKGHKLVDVRVGSADFCAHVAKATEGKRCCATTLKRVLDGPLAPVADARPAHLGVGGSSGAVPRGMLAVPCFTGLRYLVLPLEWSGEPLGRVILGPFSPEDVRDLPPVMELLKLDLSLARANLGQVRRVSEPTVAKVLLHLAQILDALVAAGHKTFLTSGLHLETERLSHRELEAKNRKLNEMYEKLRELDRLKSSFLSTVSHELRAPLSAIMGYAELLVAGMAGPLNPEQTDCLRTIQDKGDALLQLISSILDFSQIESGKVRLVFEPTDITAVLTEAVTTLSPEARRKGLKVEVELGNRRERVVADSQKLRQVVVNLLGNAVKFTPEGGRIRLGLTFASPDPLLGVDGYRIAIEDTGAGIPDDQREKIFQSFYQADHGSTRQYGGAGLGLAIVKSYVEGHGGQVWVESALAQGSTFTVALPRSAGGMRSTAAIAPPASEPPVPDRF
jgi:signal transduction histidine kinase